MRDKTQTAVDLLKTKYADGSRTVTKKTVNDHLTKKHGSGCPIMMLELRLRGYVTSKNNTFYITSKAS